MSTLDIWRFGGYSEGIESRYEDGQYLTVNLSVRAIIIEYREKAGFIEKLGIYTSKTAAKE